MIWKILFILSVLIAVIGIPLLFIHPIGWGMLFGGVWLAYMSGEKALHADSKGDLRKTAEKLKSSGKFTITSKPLSQFDPIQRQLEQLGLLFVEDVRIASEKNAAIRLMRNQEGKIWAVIRRHFATSGVTFYAFGANGSVICLSNSIFPLEISISMGRTIQAKYPRKNLSEIFQLMSDQTEKLEYDFPEGFDMTVLPLETPAEFIQKLDEFKFRRQLSVTNYDQAMLSDLAQPLETAEYLLKLQAINRNEYWDYLPSLTALRLVPANGKAARSHLGGLPELPPDTAWPVTPGGQPMNFIGRLDCSELPEDKSLPAMPRTGSLVFFCTLEGDEFYFGGNPGDECGWRVLFLEKTDTLKTPKAPEGLIVFKEFAVTGVAEKTYLGGHINSPRPCHQLFGYPDYIQSPTMTENCAKVTQTKYPSNPEDWLLLLQVDTDYAHSDLQFADMGTLFFWIRQEDLANRRFDRVWMIMECY